MPVAREGKQIGNGMTSTAEPPETFFSAYQNTAVQRTEPARDRIRAIIERMLTGRRVDIDVLTDEMLRVAEKEQSKHLVIGFRGVRPRPRIKYITPEMHPEFHTEYGSVVVSTVMTLFRESIKARGTESVTERIGEAIAQIFRKTDLSTKDYSEEQFGEDLKYNTDERKAPTLYDWATSNKEIPQHIKDTLDHVLSVENSQSPHTTTAWR